MWIKDILFYDITKPFKRKSRKKQRKPLRLRIIEYNKKWTE